MKMDTVIERIPYAQYLGISVLEEFSDGALFQLQPEERFIGNPMLRAFHGGIICGLMECALSLTAMRFNDLDDPPRLINQTTSYLGSATMESALNVRTELTKPGKRILGANARAFQASEQQLVAKCSTLFKAQS